MHKINRVNIYALIMIATFLDVALTGRIEVFGARPDLAIILVIFFGLFGGAGRGMESGLVAGLLKDIFALDYFGINVLILGLVGLISGLAGSKISRESRSTQFISVLSFSALSMLVHFLAVNLKSGSFAGFGLFQYLAGSILPVSAYTAIVSIPIFAKLIGAYGLKELEGLL